MDIFLLIYLYLLTSVCSVCVDADVCSMFVIVCCQNGSTALICSAQRGNIVVVQLLLDNGADVNINENSVSNFSEQTVKSHTHIHELSL